MSMTREDMERDLDEFVEGEYWPKEGEDFVPPATAEAASAVLRRIRRLEREQQELSDVAQAEIDRITLWRDDRISTHAFDIARGTAALELYARTVIPDSGKKSVALPSGTLKLKDPGKGRIEIDDADALVAWATKFKRIGTPDKPDLVNLVPTPSKSTIGEKCKQSDEPMATTIDDDGVAHSVYALRYGTAVVPGVTRVVAQDDKFSYVTADE